MYQIEFKKSAKKEFEHLPKLIQKKIVEALEFIKFNPFSELLNIKKLKGVESVFRIRVGDYRILYEVHTDRVVVIIIKIGHRSEVYRR